jgi:putative ABC transport system permease protein
MLRAIDTKLLRDARAMIGQVAAIVAVLACGVGLFLGMYSAMRSLEAARASYYAEERFAHIFARLVRAPERTADALRALLGVQRVQTRVVADVTLDVPRMPEAASGLLVSIPDGGPAAVNAVRLRSGRWPAPERADEVLASEAFAVAHALPLGAEIEAVINGRRQRLRVVGTALSPEFTYVLGAGQLFPDDRRYGVLWMRRTPLAAALDMRGAFNDVVLQLGPDAKAGEVIARTDEILDPAGGTGAIGRDRQQSAFFVENELAQLRSFGLFVPAAFLLVAAVLLNVVVGRIVASQREQIAAMKALGYRDRDVGLHYAKGVGTIVLLGWLGGILLGDFVGGAMIGVYGDFYRFPNLRFAMRGSDVLGCGAVAAAGAVIGTFTAIRRTVRLPPAEAMRPEAPAAYRETLFERLGLAARIPPAARMVVRELERRPLRAGLSVVGIALATALVVLSTFSLGSVGYMVNVQFGLQQREDVQLTLANVRSLSAVAELRHLPGVLHAEPFRVVPARLRAGSRSRTTAVTGIPRGATLQAILDVRLDTIAPPAAGMVLSRTLAEVLGVSAGGVVTVEVLEGARPARDVTVARVAETFVGLSAYMELGALSAMLGEAPSLSGAWLSVDEHALPALHTAVKDTPAIAGITERHRALQSFQKIMDENLGTSITMSLGFSLIMALGVLYNAARITLAERARDLASLRVMGFRRAEVTAILLGEIAVLTALAVPLGLLIGVSLAAALVKSPGFASEQLRIPLVIEPRTLVWAAATIVFAAALSGFAAWRRLERIDIVEVLKTRD